MTSQTQDNCDTEPAGQAKVKFADNCAHIAVVGLSGAGKSSLIDKMPGVTNATVGHTLDSCTADVQIYSVKGRSRQGIIIDTPGFGDRNRTDADILQLLAEYLSRTYQEGHKLTAVLYVIDINNRRYTATSERTSKRLDRLLGEDCMKNVFVVTTGWDLVRGADEKTSKNIVDREEELRGALKVFSDGGATFLRHDNTVKSAEHILEMALSQGQMTTKIQDEMTREGKAIQETDAGKLETEHQEEMKSDLLSLKRMIEEKDKELKKLQEGQAEQLKQQKASKERLKRLEDDLTDATLKLKESQKSYRMSGEKEEEKWYDRPGARAAVDTAAMFAATTACRLMEGAWKTKQSSAPQKDKAGSKKASPLDGTDLSMEDIVLLNMLATLSASQPRDCQSCKASECERESGKTA